MKNYKEETNIRRGVVCFRFWRFIVLASLYVCLVDRNIECHKESRAGIKNQINSPLYQFHPAPLVEVLLLLTVWNTLDAINHYILSDGFSLSKNHQ